MQRRPVESSCSPAILGGVAVCLHGYQRNTIDLDLLVRAEDQGAIRQTLAQLGYLWSEEHAELRAESGVPVQFLMAGERAGKGVDVQLPDPADEQAVTRIEGLPVLSLAKLIESKIACGQGNLRRTHKDFADVVELIVNNSLDSSFARFLHKSLRPAFRQLARAAKSP